jgi:hypothetical protein
LSAGYENTKITNEESYSGEYSLVFENLDGTRDGFVGTRKYAIGDDIKVGDVLRISVWLKGKDLDPQHAATVGDAATFSITPMLHNKVGNNEGFGDFWASDIPLKFPAVTSFDWQQFYVDVPVQEGTKAISVRLHPLGQFKGTVYCDLLTVEKLDVPKLSEIGSFEQALPSYWNKGGEPTGSTLSWATDQSKSMGRSLKIAKTGTGEEAYWQSENMCDLWAPIHNKDVDIFLGAYVKTEGVNVNPADDDSKWWISYSFYGQTGTLIGEVKLPINQSVATSTGWAADTNAVGSAILPEDSYTTIIKFVAGKNATGTVWADDFMLYGRGGAWAGQDWNTQVGVPTGWFYWLPPVGGNDGVLSAGYENTKITNEESYSGEYSLVFKNLDGTRDGFVGTRKYAIGDDIKVGDVLRISVWLKEKI